jgi:stage III sporulation protein AC
MDIGLIMKVGGVGMIVTVICQVLSRAGRDDQATLVSVSGIVLILIILMGEIGELLYTVMDIFGL